MVAINPMRGKRTLSQLAFNFFSNPHTLELDESNELINLKRLANWKKKDEQSN